MSVEKGMASSIAINFFLAAGMQISMKYVWGIINYLQIVTHLPLLIPNLPSNFQAILKIIYDIANL